MSVIDGDHWREIYEVLRGNKLRTFLTAFGVFWGIFMLMVMLGSGKGLSNGVEQGFSDGATNAVFIWSQRTTKPWRGMAPGRPVQLETGDMSAPRPGAGGRRGLPAQSTGRFPRRQQHLARRQGGAFSVMGDTPRSPPCSRCVAIAGRFLNCLDIAERRKVTVLGPRPLEVLFARGEDPIGQTIRISGVEFKVVGTFKPRRSDGNDRDDQAQSLFVPFTTFQSAFNYGDRVGWFAITSKPGVPATILEEKALRLLRERHTIAPDDERALGHFNLEKEYKKVTGLFAGIRILVWIVGVGTLAAGVIGVSNIMLVIVRERTNETACGAPSARRRWRS
jgi:putative ABC transport system permease protein